MNMKYLIGILLVYSLPFLTMAQPAADEGNPITQSFTLNETTSKYVIEGTSTLHDWEMISEKCKGSITYTLDGTDLNIGSIKVIVGVETLKSGKKTMDNKCYEALKSDDFPNITYEFKSASSMKSTGNGNFTAVFNGNLTIAGNTKNIPIDVTIEATTGSIKIKGRKPIKMTDFGVEPPTALLGTIKTGNDITIDFNLNYN